MCLPMRNYVLIFMTKYLSVAMSKCDFKVLSIFIEITLWHGCSPVNLLHIFRTPFFKNTTGWLLPCYASKSVCFLVCLTSTCYCHYIHEVSLLYYSFLILYHIPYFHQSSPYFIFPSERIQSIEI